MVEVMLVLVEAADGDGQIPALALLLRGVGVEHPLVAGREDGHRAGRLQVVYIEGHLRIAVDIVLRDDTDAQALVVELLAGIDLQGLLRHLARPYLNGARGAGERHAVNHQAGTVGILHIYLVEVEVDVGGLGLLALVGDVELEAGGFAEGHAAQALLVHLDLWILNLLGTNIEHRTGAVEQRLALALPRTAGGTATGAIDEAGGIAEVAGLELAAQVGIDVGPLLPEVLAEEDVVGAIVRQWVGQRRGPIDVEVEVAALVHAHGEALRAAVRRRLRVLRRHTEAGHRREDDLYIGTHALELDAGLRSVRQANHVGGQRADECGGVGQSVVEVAVGDGGEGTYEGVHDRIVALERLAVVDGRAAIHVVVGHEVGGVHLRLLVTADHLYPGLQALVVAVYLVLEFLRCIGGQNHLVFRTEALALAAHLRQIDGLLLGIGLHLGFLLSAGEHERLALLGELRYELFDDVLLRVDEVRPQRCAVGQHLVAYQVQGIALVVDTSGYLHHAARLEFAARPLERAVGDGAYGGGGLHLDVLHRADVEVAVGTHQFRVRTGRDVLGGGHRVFEGALAAARECQVDAALSTHGQVDA